MKEKILIFQTPEPGRRIQKFKGDKVAFEISLQSPCKGNAWLRTNIGHASITRQEIIRSIEKDETPLAQDWFDIPMIRIDERSFRLNLALNEVGHFEAKCLFIPEKEIDPVWPDGPNTGINVQPAYTCCANIIYNAFVRQFGPNKTDGLFKTIPKEWVDVLDNKGCAVIPPSGTFRDLKKELDFIMGELGCRIIQLLPIHPTPTTFARMGRYGSPYAALNFTTVDPALAEFDPKATPLDQFIELVDEVHRRNGKIIIDIAINHTGWGADLHETHPDWLSRDREGKIEAPGAWGVIWEDLAKLDYSNKYLWQYIANVFLTWRRRGVDGFRCDAGYMIPVSTWEYIISRVREQYDDTIFFLEGLGGKISTARDLLNTANFNWAYSELFQNYDRNQIENYLSEAIDISLSDGNLIHFAETHDNPRLAGKSKIYAKMRTALCALSSINGGFGFTNGVEWFATEKIVVHEAHSLNWGAKENQVDHIKIINRILREHPAFHDQTALKMVQTGQGNYIALFRHNIPTGKKLLILANLDTCNEVICRWRSQPGIEGPVFFDLLTKSKHIAELTSNEQSCRLEPGQVLCLSDDHREAEKIHYNENNFLSMPERAKYQLLKAKVFEMLEFAKGWGKIDKINIDEAIGQLFDDPYSFCCRLNSISKEPMVIRWEWPKDLKRNVMMPPSHFLLITARFAFHAELIRDGFVLKREESIKQKDHSFFAVFSPIPTPDDFKTCLLKLTVYEDNVVKHKDAAIIYLPEIKDVAVKTVYSGREVRQSPLTFLNTNGKGGMLHSSLSWGHLSSKYDALLAANLNPLYPEDRRILFARCRAWVVYQGYSHEINNECLNIFYFDQEGAGCWQYFIPVGQGQHIGLTVKIKMTYGANEIRLLFLRHNITKNPGGLAHNVPVRIILRPDIEDRNFHDTTKAYTGPEQKFPQSINSMPDGFKFAPEKNRTLNMKISSGGFIFEPEWHYMVYRPLEAQRGLDPDSDLFSPGYFSSLLFGGEAFELTAFVSETEKESKTSLKFKIRQKDMFFSESKRKTSLATELEHAMNHYIVERMGLKSVIAGYPWFLDWGRDALIFARGLIAGGKFDSARDILKQFGKFEKNGTLPNMIKGNDAANLDTSDAPLWFCNACYDLVSEQINEGFLAEQCGNKTIREVLLSIGKSFSSQTDNQIRFDPESGLIYSPAHFTWMDTNYPAGTPRQGYPIEIQALWHRALRFFAVIDQDKKASFWLKLSDKVKNSISELYYIKNLGFLSDCLHTSSFKPAAFAEPDDALRPNQLLAITLGAIEDKNICKMILSSCEELIVPGAIRSLADRQVNKPIEILLQGKIINNPYYPYQGQYKGDEDTQRKPAYHNGTAWTWLFPSFCEAWVHTYGEAGKKTALSILSSSVLLINQGCVGHVPEILDGDRPHIQRGCDAQAWGVSEIYRVLKKLSG